MLSIMSHTLNLMTSSFLIFQQHHERDIKALTYLKTLKVTATVLKLKHNKQLFFGKNV